MLTVGECCDSVSDARHCGRSGPRALGGSGDDIRRPPRRASFEAEGERTFCGSNTFLHAKVPDLPPNWPAPTSIQSLARSHTPDRFDSLPPGAQLNRRPPPWRPPSLLDAAVLDSSGSNTIGAFRTPDENLACALKSSDRFDTETLDPSPSREVAPLTQEIV